MNKGSQATALEPWWEEWLEYQTSKSLCAFYLSSASSLPKEKFFSIQANSALMRLLARVKWEYSQYFLQTYPIWILRAKSVSIYWFVFPTYYVSRSWILGLMYASLMLYHWLHPQHMPGTCSIDQSSFKLLEIFLYCLLSTRITGMYHLAQILSYFWYCRIIFIKFLHPIEISKST